MRQVLPIPLDVQKLKRFQLHRGFEPLPLDPLTSGSAPGPASPRTRYRIALTRSPI